MKPKKVLVDSNRYLIHFPMGDWRKDSNCLWYDVLSNMPVDRVRAAHERINEFTRVPIESICQHSREIPLSVIERAGVHADVKLCSDKAIAYPDLVMEVWLGLLMQAMDGLRLECINIDSRRFTRRGEYDVMTPGMVFSCNYEATKCKTVYDDLRVLEDKTVDRQPVQVEVTRDGKADIRFMGWLLGMVEEKDALTGVPHEYRLYRTVGGKYVCYYRRELPNEAPRFNSDAFNTLNDVYKFFGYSNLAKKLYACAGLNACEHID